MIFKKVRGHCMECEAHSKVEKKYRNFEIEFESNSDNTAIKTLRRIIT